MNVRESRPGLGDVLAALEQEQLLSAGWRDALAAETGFAADATPWFVRAMVGFGAWLAALLLIAFVVGISIAASGSGYLVLAILFIGGAFAVRRGSRSYFVGQVTLAVSLAGQGLLAVAIFETSAVTREVELVLAVLAMLNLVLAFVFPDRTHRFISSVAAVACACGLLYANRLQALVPFVGPALAGLLIALFRFEARFAARGWLGALSAVRAGVLVGAFGCLTLSTVYVLPELVDDFVFYPRPWISTLLLGALLLPAERDFIRTVFGPVGDTRLIVAYALTIAVVLVSLPAPGLILALLVCVIGGNRGSRFYLGAGIAFTAFFTATYFYGIDVGMLLKSASLVGTGLVVLFCRWLFIRTTRDIDSQRPPQPANADPVSTEHGNSHA